MPPRAPHQIGGVAQEVVGGRAPPVRVARREMHADIAGADRAQHRVGQRVQADIGVGMADEAGVVRDRDAADADVVAGAEGMHVEALADPHIAEPRCEQPFGGGQVLGRRHLEIVLAAGDQRRASGRQPRRPPNHRSVPALRRRGVRRGWRRSESPAASAPATGSARSIVVRIAPSSARLIVSPSGRHGIAAGAWSSASMTRSIRPRRETGARRRGSGRGRAMRRRAPQGRAGPNPAASAPPGDRRQQVEPGDGAGRTRRGPPAGSRPARRRSRGCEQSGDGVAQHGCRRRAEVLLGQLRRRTGCPGRPRRQARRRMSISRRLADGVRLLPLQPCGSAIACGLSMLHCKS